MGVSNFRKNSLRRIALLISMYFPPEPGGGARTAFNRALILNKMGYSVFVLCGFPSYPSGAVTEKKYKGKFFYVENKDDFTLIRLRLLPLASKGYLKRLILFLNFNFLSLFWMFKILRIVSKVELVYALAPILFSSYIGYFYSKIAKAYFVYEVSAFWPEELIAFSNKSLPIMALIGKALAKISYIVPDMLVMISNSAAELVAKNYHPKNRIYTLPIGVDPKRFLARTKESSRRELIQRNIFPANLEGKFIALYSGVITKITKVDNIVYAANRLQNKKDNIAFVIIGEGEEKQKLQDFGLDNRIDNLYFLPFQHENIVPYIISAADVCVVPLSSEPIYQTTVPTKFYDYLACHKPQIGICEGELANLINNNNIGITVKSGEIDNLVEKIIFLKNSPSTLESMQRNSITLMANFTLDRLAYEFNLALKLEIANKKR